MKPPSSEGTRALEVVVCLEDSIIDVIHLRAPGQVRAGHDPGCHVILPAEALGGSGSLVLASLDATRQAYAALSLDGQGGLRPITPQDNVSLESGKLRVFVRTVPDTESATRGRWGIDAQALKVTGASLVGHLMFVWLLLAIPHDARAVNGLDFYRSDRLVHVVNLPNEDALQKPPPPGPKGATGQVAPEGESTAAHTGPAGKMGKPDVVAKGSTSLKGPDAIDKPSGNPRDWVSSRGLLGVMKATDWSPITGADAQFAKSDRWAYGGDPGTAPGDGTGTLGTGYDGRSTGGCPPGTKYCNDGSIGTGGRLPTIGMGPGGSWQGTGSGPGGLRPRDHRPEGPVVVGPPKVGPDGLDKQIIKRYIHDKIAAISYCYERQLNVREAIGGTITVEFVIGPNGAVISARGDGSAGAAEVDACVLEQVRGIQFPRSEGLTNVKYPFTFHTAGQ
jgi:TonB family protein